MLYTKYVTCKFLQEGQRGAEGQIVHHIWVITVMEASKKKIQEIPHIENNFPREQKAVWERLRLL